MTTTPVARVLGDLAHAGGRACAAACDCPPPRVLADRPDGTVVRRGPVVAKAHAPDTDRPDLADRLALAAAPLLAGVLLPPLPVPAPRQAPETAARRPAPAAPPAALLGMTPDGRPVSLWPHGEPVDPADPDAAPWEEAGTLLARLHRTPPPHPLPPMRGPAKAARAVARMRAARPGDPDTAPVLAAWRGLPAWARDEAPSTGLRARFVCHGDLHLGQLVRHPAPNGPWLLIDVDDAGLGDPAWDLARAPPRGWGGGGVGRGKQGGRVAVPGAGGPARRPPGGPGAP
ncbi:phosphotransferase, partial [Streptomyces sp. NPDC001876]|uniref:phosphotransferase n=1 Tax=Streptomyces sp. NPDC001876 TaxID=3154402 RepID=UPI00332BF8B5